MINKNQSISVRLSQDDYEFLMAINQNNALTQSDKVRELIQIARTTNHENFAGTLLRSYRAFEKRKIELLSDIENRSTLIEYCIDLLTEGSAVLEHHQDDYKALEKDLSIAAARFYKRVDNLLKSPDIFEFFDKQTVLESIREKL